MDRLAQIVICLACFLPGYRGGNANAGPNLGGGFNIGGEHGDNEASSLKLGTDESTPTHRNAAALRVRLIVRCRAVSSAPGRSRSRRARRSAPEASVFTWRDRLVCSLSGDMGALVS